MVYSVYYIFSIISALFKNLSSSTKFSCFFILNRKLKQAKQIGEKKVPWREEKEQLKFDEQRMNNSDNSSKKNSKSEGKIIQKD
jgi:hypothetical protein